jgi:pimeloyl-ACP methyl ester carboxylesterase
MGTQVRDEHEGRYVHANGIDVHYVEIGTGAPLIVLENGMISTNPIWLNWPSSYAGYLSTLARQFRVIAPDFRGSGRTVHSGGPISYALLADDVVALIDALELDGPLVCGYGDGAMVATVVGIRKPGSVRALVNHGGLMLDPDPQAPALVLTRQMLGGSLDATHADPDAVAESPFLGVMVELMKADHDAAQGAGHWKTVLCQTFDRVSQPSGYTVEDLPAITAPTLVMVGDRDQFGSVEEAVAAYRALPVGELTVLPNSPGGISPVAIQATVDFFQRRLGTSS